MNLLPRLVSIINVITNLLSIGNIITTVQLVIYKYLVNNCNRILLV